MIKDAGKGIGKIPDGEENKYFFKPYTHWHQISKECYETLLKAGCAEDILQKQE
jgi:hypothetical protein